LARKCARFKLKGCSFPFWFLFSLFMEYLRFTWPAFLFPSTGRFPCILGISFLPCSHRWLIVTLIIPVPNLISSPTLLMHYFALINRFRVGFLLVVATPTVDSCPLHSNTRSEPRLPRNCVSEGMSILVPMHFIWKVRIGDSVRNPQSVSGSAVRLANSA
jgi:hypothetical protein